MNTAQPWSQPEALDPMAQMSTDLDDLGNLFEFGDIDLNNISGNVENNGYGNPMQQMHVSHPSTPFDEMGPSVPPTTSMQDFVRQDHYNLPQDLEPQQQQFNNGHPATTMPYSTQAFQPAMSQMYMHRPQQFKYSQHPRFAPGQHVPPTPTSFDMHGESAPFMHLPQQQQHQSDHQQRPMFEHQQRYMVRKDDANIAFTPMASPAGTPSNYNMASEFTVNPGAYFSPLTSPMIHAQNAPRQQQQGLYTNPSTAPSSNATSPIDGNIDVDMNSDIMSLPDPASGQAAKSNRKATARGLAASNRAKQSPIQKAQKRKSSTMLAFAPTRFADSSRSQSNSAGPQKPAAFTGSSEDGSISPEPFNEASMGPPPRPTSSLTQSPAMTPYQQKDSASTAVGPAATPKSLLSRGSASQPINVTEQGSQAKEPGNLDDLQLPEASVATVGPPKQPQINTKIEPPQPDADEEAPRTSSRKTPKLGPLSTPSSARPSSALASPSVAASPMTASTPGALLKDKKDAKGVRTPKKRGSAGPSTMPSPALRPRISPSIKPLLPEGTALHSPTHALLLASKSNYQNLLEGNHLPGVNYPDSLSTGLTSKRTSHKVAEQGRRNRINEALKEMQALVPKQALKAIKECNSDGSPEADGGADREGKDGKDDAAMKASKAATVELANIYIRSMQEKERQMEERLAELERKNAEMAKKLNEQNGGVISEKAVDSASPVLVRNS
ncbi:hypothetical protein EJ03DRAFT_44692 [Teratosphaeria nubilosa]|uniref:BHLH domain-containing protein n=1 Tax=Teratosphaeria nubilosa TaxID=161662 RepID=A0A6G1LER0_9PEZI|nr:hypothetical protein EJ03DRAFT_44692 [Teratosphaeria nubilosa]